MPTMQSRRDVNETAATAPVATPLGSAFNPVGDLNLHLRTQLAAYDEDLMTDPQSGVETVVQTLSRALGIIAPIAVLALMGGVVTGAI